MTIETNARPERPDDTIRAVIGAARAGASVTLQADEARAFADGLIYLEDRLRAFEERDRQGTHGIRRPVLGFAWLMEHRLRQHDADRGARSWIADQPGPLLDRVRERVDALGEALQSWSAPWQVGRDGRALSYQVAHAAADVANFAMMVADVVHPELEDVGPGQAIKRRKRLRQVHRMHDHLEGMLERRRVDGVTPQQRIRGLEDDLKALAWVLRLLDPSGEHAPHNEAMHYIAGDGSGQALPPASDQVREAAPQ